MTKEEWEKAEEALTRFYSTVELNIDGYKVELVLRKISTYKNAIMFYINGVFKGEWFLNDCEERRRFFRKQERTLLNAKGKAAFKKLSKKRQQEWKEQYTYYTYDCFWSSFGSLKRHLEKENKSIELVNIKGV